jgi:hypothetical protein
VDVITPVAAIPNTRPTAAPSSPFAVQRGDPLWFKPVPPDRCAPEYVATSWKACDRAQTCVSDDEGAGDGWLACQSKWFLEAERAWFDYLNCVSPVVRPTDDRRD